LVAVDEIMIVLWLKLEVINYLIQIGVAKLVDAQLAVLAHALVNHTFSFVEDLCFSDVDSVLIRLKTPDCV
jgi:hypothetical protein